MLHFRDGVWSKALGSLAEGCALAANSLRSLSIPLVMYRSTAPNSLICYGARTRKECWHYIRHHASNLLQTQCQQEGMVCCGSGAVWVVCLLIDMAECKIFLR